MTIRWCGNGIWLSPALAILSVVGAGSGCGQATTGGGVPGDNGDGAHVVGTVTSALAADDGINPTSVVSLVANRLDVFYRGHDDDQLYTSAWNGLAWVDNVALGGTLTSAPTVIAHGNGELSVFARDGSNSLVRKRFDGVAWHAFEVLGSPAASGAPSASGIDGGIRAFAGFDGTSLTTMPVVVVRGSDGYLFTMDFKVGPYPPWVPTGVGFIGNPALVSCDGTTYIFIRAADSTLKWARWDGSNWTTFGSLGGVLTSSPTAVSMVSGRMDIFVRDTSGALKQSVFTGNCRTGVGTWTGFFNRGGSFTGDPEAVSWGTNRIDIFARETTSGGLYSWAWDGTTWTYYQPGGGGVFLASPSVVAWGPNRLDVFMRGVDSALKHKAWNGTAWAPNPTLESHGGYMQ